MRRAVIMSGPEVETLRRLGQTVRLARLRRNLSQAELAERMGVARPTVAALEKGNPGVGIGPLLKAMSVMGYTGRLGDLLAADPIGDDLDAVTGRKRGGRSAHHVASF